MVTPRKPTSSRPHDAAGASSGGGRQGRQGGGRGRDDRPSQPEGYGRGEGRQGNRAPAGRGAAGQGGAGGGYNRGAQGNAEGGYRDNSGTPGGQNRHRGNAQGNNPQGGGRFNTERSEGYQNQNRTEGGARGRGGNVARDDNPQGRSYGDSAAGGRFNVERGARGEGTSRGRGGNVGRDDNQQGRGYGEGGRGRFTVERGEGGLSQHGQAERGGRGRGGQFNPDDTQQAYGEGAGRGQRVERKPRTGQGEGNRRPGAEGGQGFGRSEQRQPRTGQGEGNRRPGAEGGQGFGRSEERQPRAGQGEGNRRNASEGGQGSGRSQERQPRVGQGQGNRHRAAEGGQGYSRSEERQPRVGHGEGNRHRDAEGAQGRGDARRPAPAQPPVERAKKMRQRRGSEEHKAITQQLREKRVDDRFVGELRIQKALALSGVGSRRDCDVWVSEGRVSVNGHVVEPGARVKPGDMVRFDGKPLDIKWPDRLPRVVLYHKQEGELVSRDDPEGRTTVFERLPKVQSSAWVAVGRLDFNTSGLLIFTTSGDLANRLMHPRFEVEREYAVRLLGALTDEQVAQLKTGIELEDGEARFDVLEDQGGEGKNHWYRVILREGRNREVRRMFEHFELQVSRLMRVRFGAITLPSRLKRGQYYELDETEVLSVLKWAGLGMTGRVGSRQ